MQALNLTRDQIDDFDSYYGNRYVSLDCNDSYGRTAQGIELVVPSNIHPDELEMCRLNVTYTHMFFNDYGWNTPIRRGDGIKYGGGHPGVIHTEHYFIYNETPRRIIAENASEYADILISTLGQIEGMSFILPHRKRDPGATSLDGYTEQGMAKYNIMPSLLHKSQLGMSLAQGTNPSTFVTSGPPEVFWEEDIRPA